MSLGNMLVMTRWIGPHSYGLFVTAIGLVAFLSTLARAGADVYLVRREAAPDEHMYHVAGTLILSISVALTLIGAALAPLLIRWYSHGEFLPPYLVLLLTIPVIGLTGVPMAKLERELNFRNVASIELGGQFLGLLVGMTLAAIRSGVWAPVAGQIASQIATLVAACACSRFIPRFRFNASQAREMLTFGIGLVTSLRMWQLRTLVNPLLVGRFAGAEGVAFVALGIRIAEALGAIRLAAGRLALAALSRLQNKPAAFRTALQRTVDLQVILLGPLLCGFALLGPVVLRSVIGTRWMPSLLVYPFVLKEHNGMRVVRLPTLRSKHFDTLVHTFLSTAHVLFTGCDIVHYQCLGPALFSLIPRLFGKKTVVSVQGLDWQRRKWTPIASLVLRLGERASVQLPSATMVVSKNLQRRYHSRYRNPVTYVPNGTILRKRRSPSRLAAWGLTADNYILFLGRFSPEKNCHLLIQAYEKIQTPVRLVLAGGSSHSDVYAGELRNRQTDNIRFLDWVSGDALDELLTHAMLFVLPSDIEGLSLALLDAMGAGVCVLTSDIAENCELVEGAGFTFKRGDVDDLERMLRWLISNSQARVEAAERAQERVREHYLWPVIAKEVERTYWRTMGRQNARVALPESPSSAEFDPPDLTIPHRLAKFGGQAGM